MSERFPANLGHDARHVDRSTRDCQRGGEPAGAFSVFSSLRGKRGWLYADGCGSCGVFLTDLSAESVRAAVARPRFPTHWWTAGIFGRVWKHISRITCFGCVPR